MKSIGEAFAVMAVALCVLACPLANAAPLPPDPAFAREAQEAARSSDRWGRAQTELPIRQQVREENRRIDPPPVPRRLSSDVLYYLLWGSLLAILIVLFLHLRANLWSDSRAKRLHHAGEEEIAPEATVARMDKAQIEADELARRGSFAEAMHVLLLQSVGELRRRLDVSIAASLTSREILYRIGLPPEGRDLFADIIRRVEISYFGSHQPGEEEYRACRRSFEGLTEVLRRESAA